MAFRKLFIQGNELTGKYLLKTFCQMLGIKEESSGYTGVCGILYSTPEGKIGFLTQDETSLYLLREAGFSEIVVDTKVVVNTR
jgi:hypothetical protein